MVNWHLQFQWEIKNFPEYQQRILENVLIGIFKRGNEFIGKKVGIAGEHLSGKVMADTFTKAFGEEVVYNAVPFDVYRSFGFPGADDLGNMFQFNHDFSDYFIGARSIDFTKSLNPQLKNFETG